MSNCTYFPNPDFGKQAFIKDVTDVYTAPDLYFGEDIDFKDLEFKRHAIELLGQLIVISLN